MTLKIDVHSLLRVLICTPLVFFGAGTLCFAQGNNAIAAATTLPSPPAALVLGTSKSGVTVTSMDVLAELQRAPEANRKATLANPEAVQRIVNNLLLRRELAFEATQSHLEKTPVVDASVALARDRVLSDARLAQLDTQNTPAEADLIAYARSHYAANTEKYTRGPQTRARHILLPNNGPESLATARELIVKLRAGANFEELAKAESLDRTSGERGGDLDYFGPGKMVKPFEDALNKLSKPGDLSDPVESQFGYHIIRLEDRRPKGVMTFDELQAKLVAEARATLQNEGRQKKVEMMSKNFDYAPEAMNEFAKSQAQ